MKNPEKIENHIDFKRNYRNLYRKYQNLAQPNAQIDLVAFHFILHVPVLLCGCSLENLSLHLSTCTSPPPPTHTQHTNTKHILH